MKKTIAALVAALSLAVPAVASANDSSGYYLSQHAAELNAKDAAEFRYEPWGVTADAAYCYPQFHSFVSVSKRYSGRWHRWTCTWVGTDSDGADVSGQFRITGHSDGRYGYMPVGGGLRWD